MKRRAVQIVVLVMLGAIVNVAVAWVPLFRLSEVTPAPNCSRAWQIGDQVGTVLDAHFNQWLPVDSQFAAIRPGRIQRESWALRITLFLMLGAIVNVAVALACFVYAWNPHGSLGCSRVYAGDSNLLLESRAGLPYHSVSILPFVNDQWSSLLSDSRVLTLVPAGFAINTVFYAVILWMLFAAPFVLRRRRRIKRGLCPKCGYDLRGNANANVCPECGVDSAAAMRGVDLHRG